MSVDLFDIDIDGRAISARPGESVAASMSRAGLSAMRHHDVSGEARGLYCGMGACFDCLVTINDVAGQRACMAKAEPGMKVRTTTVNPARPSTGARASSRAVDVVVVGAGPAGLSAALAAAEAGAAVVVLDERSAAGGQYLKQPTPAVVADQAHAPDAQIRAGRRLIAASIAAGVSIETDATVWHAQRMEAGGTRIYAAGANGATCWDARALVVATGAYERPWVMPGWTIPGVMTTGAAQTLLRAYGTVPGRRVLVAGNGPLNLQVATELLAAGVEIVAVAEAAPPPWRWSPGTVGGLLINSPALGIRGLRYLERLAAAGVPLLHRHIVVRAEGPERVDRATVAAIDASGTIVAGTDRTFTVDTVLTGYGFLPSDHMLRLLGHDAGPAIDRDSGIFAAGDVAGPLGGEAARAAGTMAGLAAAAYVGRIVRRDARVHRRLERHRRFQRALWQGYEAPPGLAVPLEPKTVICRCEGLTFADISRTGLSDINAIKRETRAGMGRCQGRYCEDTLRRLTGQRDRFTPQVPLKPVCIAAVAATAPAAAVATAPPPLIAPVASPDPVRLPAEVDVLILGAGIIGTCTAYELASAGSSVLVLDPGRVNGGASGANAGSLHVQLLSYALPDLESEAAAAGLALLPLQRESARRWIDWARELDAPLEAEITGGLIVGTSTTDVPRIRRLVELQRRAGIDVQFLTGAEARSLAPALGPEVLCASYSPDEGKLNPLVAGVAVARAAMARGATIASGIRVRTITESRGGFDVETDGGSIRAGHVLNAAGAWGAEAGALIGADLPIVPNFLQMMVTEPLEPLLTHLIARTSSRLTLKQTARGTIIIGGGWQAGGGADGRPRPTPHNLAGNLVAALGAVPALADVRIVRSWSAPNARVPAGAIIGEMPGHPGFFNAVTLNGLTLGPALGAILARMLRGEPAGHDLRRFQLN